MPHEGPHHTWSKVAPDFFAFAGSRREDVLLRVDLPGEDATIVLQSAPNRCAPYRRGAHPEGERGGEGLGHRTTCHARACTARPAG